MYLKGTYLGTNDDAEYFCDKSNSYSPYHIIYNIR